MLEYRVAGVTAASDANDNDAVAVLWNPHTTKPLWVAQFKFFADTGANGKVTVTRTSTRGTAGSTVTPDIDNHTDHLLAPPTGALLDLANFTVEPTKLAPDMDSYQTAATIGAGQIFDFRTALNPLGIRVLPGAGLGIINGAAALVAASHVAVLWYE